MIELLRNRRSTRKFTSSPVNDEHVQLLKETVLRAPTSKNSRPWEFVFVDDKNLLTQLAEVKPHGAVFLKDAPLGIVLAADPGKSDVWVEDCSIAAISIQYVAQSLGLGSCWIQVRKRNFDEVTTASDKVKEFLNMPGHLEVASIIAVGHPLQTRDGVDFEKLDFEKIKTNSY